MDQSTEELLHNFIKFIKNQEFYKMSNDEFKESQKVINQDLEKIYAKIIDEDKKSFLIIIKDMILNIKPEHIIGREEMCIGISLMSKLIIRYFLLNDTEGAYFEFSSWFRKINELPINREDYIIGTSHPARNIFEKFLNTIISQETEMLRESYFYKFIFQIEMGSSLLSSKQYNYISKKTNEIIYIKKHIPVLNNIYSHILFIGISSYIMNTSVIENITKIWNIVNEYLDLIKNLTLQGVSLCTMNTTLAWDILNEYMDSIIKNLTSHP